MGGAFVAVADDASAASWNPAGIAILTTPELTLSLIPFQDFNGSFPGSTGTFLSNSQTYARTDSGTSISGSSSELDYISYSHPLINNIDPNTTLVLQGGVQNAIGLDYVSTYLTPRSFSFVPSPPTSVIEQQFQSKDRTSSGAERTLHLSLAWAHGLSLAVGVAINYWQLKTSYTDDVSLFQISTDTVTRSTVNVEGVNRFRMSASGPNTNVGLLVHVGKTKGLGMALVYKTGYQLRGDYRYTQSHYGPFGPPFFFQPWYDLTVTADSDIRWPTTRAVGLSWRPTTLNRRLLFSADYTHTSWATATINIKNCIISAPGLPTEPCDTGTFPFPAITDSGEQTDTIQKRLGAEFRAGADNSIMVPVRFGLYRDNAIFESSSGGAIPINGISLGSGIAYQNRFFVDLALIHEQMSGSVDTSDALTIGRRDGGRDRLFLSLIVRFPGKDTPSEAR